MQFITNPQLNDDHQSFINNNIDERISNIAFICDNNNSVNQQIITKSNDNCFDEQQHQPQSNQKLINETLQKSQKKLQRDRRHSILSMNNKRRKSMKIARSLRDQARAKAKRDRDNIYNTCRKNLKEKSFSSNDDDELIENNNNNNNNSHSNLKMFENFLQTKHCDMPYNTYYETPISSISKYRSSSIDGITNDSSKTIYPNTSGNRKIPYLRYSSKTISRQTLLGKTTDTIMMDANIIIDSCIDRPRIRLIDLCSWQQLDRSVQSIALFFVCCFIVNLYQIICG